MVETGTRGKGQGVWYSRRYHRLSEVEVSGREGGLKVTNTSRRCCETALPGNSTKQLHQFAALAVRPTLFLTPGELNWESLFSVLRFGHFRPDKPLTPIPSFTPCVIKSNTKKSRWVAAEAGSLMQHL